MIFPAGRIGGIAAYGGGLYWLSDALGPNGECLANRTLANCEPNNCQGTIEITANELPSNVGYSAPILPMLGGDAPTLHHGSVFRSASSMTIGLDRNEVLFIEFCQHLVDRFEVVATR